MNPIQILFVCTGNSARSILAEAALNAWAGGRFRAFSAGSRPTGHVHPQALAVLERHGIATAGLDSKPWDRFTATEGPRLDIVTTVCDRAADEPCPVLFGDFVRTHWGLPDPAATAGDAQEAAFERTFATLHTRLHALLALPLESVPREAWTGLLEPIGHLDAGDAA